MEFLEWTAWTMETPKPYGAFHLIFFFVGLALAILLAFFLRKTNERQNKILMVTLAIILIAGEAYKLLFYTFYLNGGKFLTWTFPFQLCSVPMYLCLIVPFVKNEKVKNALYNFIFAFNMFGGLMAFIVPDGIVHPYVTLTLHAFLWHLVLIFIGIYLFLSKRAGNRLRDYWSAVKVFLVVVSIAFVLNLIIRNGVNLFFISPFYVPQIVFFSDTFVKLGWFLNSILFLFALCLGAYISFFIMVVSRKVRSKRNQAKLREEVRKTALS